MADFASNPTMETRPSVVPSTKGLHAELEFSPAVLIPRPRVCRLS